jgi:hypothetical protein
MTVSGTGVPPNTTVVAFTGTTVTMSNTSTAGVANAAAITFGGGTTLSRENLLFSGTGGFINFSAGVKQVFLTFSGTAIENASVGTGYAMARSAQTY